MKPQSEPKMVFNFLLDLPLLAQINFIYMYIYIYIVCVEILGY